MASGIDTLKDRLDLVDSNDKVIGTVADSDILSLEESKRGFVRASLVFLVNNRGELWIPTRSLKRKLAPGGYDSSVAKHVTQQQSYADAAVEGLKEETGLNVSVEDLELIGIIPPYPKMPYFHHVYLYAYNKTPPYDTDAYIDYAWIQPVELLSLLNNNVVAKDILKPAVELIVSKKGYL